MTVLSSETATTYILKGALHFPLLCALKNIKTIVRKKRAKCILTNGHFKTLAQTGFYKDGEGDSRLAKSERTQGPAENFGPRRESLSIHCLLQGKRHSHFL